MNVRPSKLTIIVFLLRHNVADITLIDNFQYHDKSIDTENISPWDQSKNAKITDIVVLNENRVI
jgi:hypothetical protein